MLHRFTERARRSVFFAQEEAGLLGENYVSTEHLLLGLMRENDTVAARVLSRIGVSQGNIRSEVIRQVTRGEGHSGQEMQLSPAARRVIDLSYNEARNLSNGCIGTEHLLIGLMREAEGLGARVLAKMGVELERARREVRTLQNNDSGNSPAPAGKETEPKAAPEPVEKASDESNGETRDKPGGETQDRAITSAPSKFQAETPDKRGAAPQTTQPKPSGASEQSSAARAASSAPTADDRDKKSSDKRCALCGKTHKHVKRLILGVHGGVCVDCVERCNAILQHDGSGAAKPQAALAARIDELSAQLQAKEQEIAALRGEIAHLSVGNAPPLPSADTPALMAAEASAAPFVEEASAQKTPASPFEEENLDDLLSTFAFSPNVIASAPETKSSETKSSETKSPETKS